jgi:malonyl-CoA/methylmalonyl-CoA synthetase
VYSNKKVNFVTPLFLKADKFRDRVAINDQHGTYLYGDLLHFSNLLADRLLLALDDKGRTANIVGKEIAFLCENDASYVIAQWAIWMYTCCAVPLCKSHPESELEYFVTNSNSSLIIATEEFAPRVKSIADKHNVLLLEMKDTDYKIGAKENGEDARVSAEVLVHKANRTNRNNQLLEHNKFKSSKALMVYTSGTTGKPKVLGIQQQYQHNNLMYLSRCKGC